MLKYLQYGVLILMSLLSMILYYFIYPHPEDRSFMLIYLLIVGIIFGVYKMIQGLVFSKIEIRIPHLIYFFLAHLCILCLCFFAFSGMSFLLGFSLFFKIIFFLFCVSALWLLIYSFGRTVFRYAKIFHFENKSSEIFASIGLGFGIYMMGVFACAALGMYTLSIISVWTLVCALVGLPSYTHIWKTKNHIFKTYSLGDTPKNTSLSLFIDELHFLILTFIVSINFISVYRPFPIGWDDLGAYMNFPKLLTESGELIAIGKMYFFELYTGIGFLVGSQTFAFYLSSFSGVMTGVVMYIGLTNLFRKMHTPFDFSLFCVMIFLMLPMSVFQLAKDMKLDFGLLAISSIALFLMYDVVGGKKFSHKKSLGALTLIGFFIGIAFSMKVTSLLLLLGILGMLFYKKLALLGLLGFFTIFVGVFTQFNLWKLMNVVVPNDMGIGTSIFSVVCIVFGICVLMFQYYKSRTGKLSGPHIISESLCIILGFIIALIPWGIKHMGEIPEGKSFEMRTLVSGYIERYNPDYSLLYNTAQLEQKEAEVRLGIQADGTTTNEDFGRYFGYEGGINNYLKLPFNLSFQLNQGGEFTDISYIFFALIPAIFLFLPYRRPKYIYPIVAGITLLLLYYIPNPLGQYITNIFSSLELPGGYICILLFIFSPLFYLYYTLDRKNTGAELCLLTLSFTSVYVFLWTISAFGIVWYGIVMYLSFLILIGSVFLSLSERNTENSGKEKYPDLNILSFIVLSIVGIYILFSVIPHGVSNLKNAGYLEYKLGEQTEETAIFDIHPEYFSILLHLNIKKEFHPELLDLYTNGGKQSVLETLISPPENMRNTEIIHRVGTFLKYYISENTKRLYEDSLITRFENYLYDENLDVTVDRFQKLGISYLLLDLNAATIDNNNSERLLTSRYENLLKFLSHDKLALIETDSICLKIALEAYNPDEDIEKYMSIAGVNYGSRELQQAKRIACLEQFVKYVQSETPPVFVNGYKNFLQSNSIKITDTNAVAGALVRFIQPGSKAVFEIQK